MKESVPWIIYPFSISMGLLFVIGVVAVVIALLAHSIRSKRIYGIAAVVGIGGAVHQLTALLYYLSPDELSAVAALRWQVDSASVLVIGVCFWVAVERFGKNLPRYIMPVFLAALVGLVVLNRAAPFSVHLAQLATHQPEQLDRAARIHGEFGWPGYVWYGVCALFLVWAFRWAWGMLCQRGMFRDGVAHMVLLSVHSAALIHSLLVDAQVVAGLYLLGFSATVFTLWKSCQVAADAAARSQRLIVREKQMENEIRQRRKAENNLERLSQVFTQAPTPTHIVDLNGRVLQVNEESVRFLRRDLSVPPQVNFFAVLAQLGENREAILQDLKAGKVLHFGPYYFTAGVPVDSLYLVRDAWLTLKTYPILDQQHKLQEFVVRLDDVTERQFVENAIRLISSAVSAETGQAFFTQLVLNLARLLNKKYVFIGLKAECDGQPCIVTQAAAIDSEVVENIRIPLADTPSQKVLERGVYVVPRQVCMEYPAHTLLRDLGVQSYLGVAITNQDRRRIGVLAVADIKPLDHIEQIQEVVNIFVARAGTELQRIEAEKQIRKMAYEDHLTGLPNRARLNEHVSDLLAETSGNTLHVFFQIDLDHFKTINDALGHDVGDEVLRSIARRFRQGLGEAAMIARIGGDEFALVFEDVPAPLEHHIARLAQQVINLTEKPVKVQDHLLDLGCTMGVVSFPDFAETAVDVFRHADIALNGAKSSGRGGYQMFTPQMRQSVSARMILEKGLRQALMEDEFHLFYQPQLDSRGGLVGAEALIRWKHADGSWTSPAEFIPVAEESGLINVIGSWVLETAIRDRKRWAETAIPFSGHVSVNVSPWQFARPDFMDGVMNAIRRLDVPPSQVTLEVTESALLTDLNETIQKLNLLRQTGFSIALDDFGTGYSSLAYLRDLPLDILKIDKSFVDALETNAHEPLVETMISIGRYMGLQVIAEGVETQIQMQRLVDLGCSVFQGYLFSRPLPEDQFCEWLKQRPEVAS